MDGQQSSPEQLELRLKQLLGPAGEVIHLHTCPSTSTHLRERIDAGAAGPLLCSADQQTAGRGTRGRSWLQPPLFPGQPARDIALSIAVPLAQPDSRLALALGVAVAAALQEEVGLPVGIKWPNDIVAGQPPLKLGGILTESSRGFLIAGVGLNVNSTAPSYPEELAGRIATLCDCAGKVLDVDALIVATAAAVLSVLAAADIAPWLQRARASDCSAGTRYRLLRDGMETAVTAEGIELPSGALRVRDEAGAPHLVTAYSELAPA